MLTSNIENLRPNRLLFPDLLRVIAILAVISIHVHTSIFFNYDASQAFNWWISNILFCMTKWAVPAFVMLSGAFILNPNKPISYKGGLIKRILKLLIPLIIWTAICKLSALLFFGPQHASVSELVLFIGKNEYLTYHLWFLYMLIGLYIISPIIQAFIKNEPESIIIVILLSFVANAVLMGFLYFNIERVVYNPLYYLTGFVFYYLTGYYLLIHAIEKKITILIYAVALTAAIAGIVMNYVLRSNQITRWDIFIDNLSPVIMIISIAIFLLFKEISWDSLFSPRIKDFIRSLSNHSYGIYLVHTIVLAAIRYYFDLKVDVEYALLYIAFSTVFIFCVSLLIVVAIKKIKYLKFILP